MGVWGGMSGWCIPTPPLVFGGLGLWILKNPSVVRYIVSWFSPSPGKKPTLPVGFPFLLLFMSSPTLKHGLLFCLSSTPFGRIYHQANF